MIRALQRSGGAFTSLRGSGGPSGAPTAWCRLVNRPPRALTALTGAPQGLGGLWWGGRCRGGTHAGAWPTTMPTLTTCPAPGERVRVCVVVRWVEWVECVCVE
jgi:hypothetical protein